MKKIILIIMLTTILTGCSSEKQAVRNAQLNNNQEQTKSVITEQSAKDTNSKAFSSLLKNMDISKSLFKKGYYDYNGTINNNIKIQMSIYKQDREIVGTYFYEKQGKEIKLKGKSDEKDIILYEYDAAGKNTGIFMGTMKTVDKIEGKWVSADNKTSYPFTLTLKSNIVADVYGKRYAVALNTKSDKDVEDFARKIQSYVVNGDKQQLAEQIKYPINAKINGKVVNIQSKEYFIKNYDQIFYPNYKIAISNSFTKNLFVNYQGIMFGQDEFNIWINEVTPTGGIPKLLITAINN
ncbi:MAG TPA: lipoprotein [Clostridium sp.]|uniref:lipoprotein n=1 Tax=Clostridium sp. TaxID=1506 RepID=UPI002F952557